MKKESLHSEQVSEVKNLINNKEKTNVKVVDLAKLEQRESRKAFVHYAKRIETSLSQRVKILRETATSTEVGKNYLSLHGYKVDDVKDIFNVPNILGMHTSFAIKKLDNFKEFVQFRKYNKEKENGTIFDIKDIKDVDAKISILDIKRFRLSTFENMFLKDSKVFIKDKKGILYVACQVDTISMFHIVQKINSYRNEKNRLQQVETRLKEHAKEQAKKEQAKKDREQAKKEVSKK